MTNHANCFHPKTAAARKACRDAAARRGEHVTHIEVIVVRRVHSDTPDQVLIQRDRDVWDTLKAQYPGLESDGFQTFTWEGDTYFYDRMSAH